jgi:hypothetical protein
LVVAFVEEDKRQLVVVAFSFLQLWYSLKKVSTVHHPTLEIMNNSLA